MYFTKLVNSAIFDIDLLGLGAISAAVMSSADSSILASSSMFSRNVYRLTLRPKVNPKKMIYLFLIFKIRFLIFTTKSKIFKMLSEWRFGRTRTMIKFFLFFHNTGIRKGTELDTSDIRACDHSLVDCDSAHGG